MLKFVSRLLLGLLFSAAALPAEAQVLREQQVLDKVTEEVVARLQVPRSDVSVEWSDLQLSVSLPVVPEGTLSLQIAEGTRLAGRSNVPVQILIDGRKFRTIFPRLDIKVLRSALVAKRAIARGQTPAPGDVELKKLPVAGNSEAPLVKLDDVATAEAARDIPAGTALTAAMFKLPTLIKRGQVVDVQVVSGDLVILSRGEAHANGVQGQMIRVMNLESKREFNARVVGPDRVEVKLEE